MKIKVSMFLLAATLLFAGGNIVSAQSAVNVRFKAGSTSQTYNGSIKGERYIDYLLSARKGQKMTVKLARRSGEYPYFNVLMKGSEVAIADDAREVDEWTGILPKNGTYAIRVYMAKAGRLAKRTSNFRITFGITNERPAGRATTIFYNCEGANLRADFRPGTPPIVRIRFGTQDIDLPLEPSANGKKYQFNNQMFWVRGNSATLESRVLNAQCRAK
ncbi:MAG: MliC family protein [Acidobacteria bacterium]|nr:MliC family protein [Acidobacteriota bacterium]